MAPVQPTLLITPLGPTGAQEGVALPGFGSRGLVAHYGPLLYLGLRLGSVDVPTLGASRLRQLIDQQLKTAAHKARGEGFDDAVIQKAEFALIALLDDRILATSGPLSREWAGQPFQLQRYGEAVAGHRFFDLVEEAQRDRSLGAKLLELYATCLLAGFTGQYHDQPQKLASFTAGVLEDLRGRAPSTEPLSEPLSQAEAGDEPTVLIPGWPRLVALVAVGAALLFALALGASLQVGSRVAEKIGEVAPPPP